MFKRIVLYILIILFPLVSVAQHSHSLEVFTDTNRIAIGEQAHITVRYNMSQKSVYQPPIYGEELIKHITFCSSPTIDTVKIATDSFQISYTYCITSFNPGEYSFQIGPILYNHKDTLWSPTLQLSVIADTVDLQGDIRDIAPLQHPQYTWYELNKAWVLWSIAGIIFIALALGIWYFIRKRKKSIIQPTVSIPHELPHIRALRLLNEIETKQLCQNNLHKQYYTEVTDVLREYFESTLHIHLFERTSDEIIRDIARTGTLSMAVIQNLQLLLHEADMVKFAKYIPSFEQTTIHGGLAVFCIKESSKTEQTDTI